jgi:tRNA1(Val) A37 N6-methylase TrmN6
MREVLKTNDPILLSFAQALLKDAGIEAVIFDTHASIMDGSSGFLPRRLMVTDDDIAEAQRVLKEAGTDCGPAVSAFTEDRFLGGRISVRQRTDGFRSGLDAVMLAAAIPADDGGEVLELGAGAGVASLCLAARVPAYAIMGVEIDAGLADLANENALTNAMAQRVRFTANDVFALPAELKREFAHSFSNPPFHGGEGAVPPDTGRQRALHDGGRLADWLETGIRRVVSGGTFTTIIRADRLGEALAVLPSTGVIVFPLWPRTDAPAKRVILQLRKGSRAALAVLPGLVLHEDDGEYTKAADAVLRRSASLALR